MATKKAAMFVLAGLAALLPATAGLADGPESGKPFHEAELVFPLEKWHNHASCLVELPNGDLLVVWYNGSGERTADDVKIEGARKAKGEKAWRPRFLMADHPGFPDTNPALFLDARKRLWLLWPVIVANEWHTALMKYRISSDYQQRDGPPRWEESDALLFVPRDFAAEVHRALNEYLKANQPSEQAAAYIARLKERAADKYFSRMGWMTRAHPVTLPSGRILVPLYSDGFSFSVMAISDDGGKTWTSSTPLVGFGNIQPSIVRKRDGTLVAYMRDNGPPPKRLHISTSRDDGLTWSPVRDTELPNPGSGAEIIRLSNGYWALAYNDTERGRHSLAVSISDDEGQTWKWTRHLELDTRGQGAGSFHYPSILQARDGRLHVSYSYFLNHLPEGAPRKSIKHAAFNLEWVQAGDPPR